jgi:aspartate-semialdehyde dehydrogenase
MLGMSDAGLETRDSRPASRVPVAILGATGTVGQMLASRLADHPWFVPATLMASEGSAGRRYGDIVRWRLPGTVPASIAGLIVQDTPPIQVPLAFSALGADVAAVVEPLLARAGVVVISNASAHRMDADVPLVIPEVNAGHLALLQRQDVRWPGRLATNPNCVVAALALALAPLHRAFGLERLVVTTLQAASGAGYPGVSSLDLLGNVIPYIAGEEAKIPRELARIVGAPGVPADLRVGVHVNRVPVVDGHLLTVSAGFQRRAGIEQAREVLRSWTPDPRASRLPSTPVHPLVLHEREDRPQPRLDIGLGDGMSVSIGRLRECGVLDLAFTVLGHNLVRGAAGAAIQLGELIALEHPALAAMLDRTAGWRQSQEPFEEQAHAGSAGGSGSVA